MAYDSVQISKIYLKLNCILFYIKEIRVTFEFLCILRDGSNIYSFSNKQRALPHIQLEAAATIP